MKYFITALVIALLSTSFSSSTKAVDKSINNPQPVIVMWPAPERIIICNAEKKAFYITLVPSKDNKNNVVSIALSILKNGKESIIGSKYNGLSPFIFPASDFADGAKSSTYGLSRILKVRGLGEARLKVSQAVVERNLEAFNGYKFSRLALTLDGPGLHLSRGKNCI